MHKLNVYRASAGSGKTFTLAVEYIRLLIENPYNYKNILAVTFTNKATSEMKERIITKLHALSVADGSANDYLQVIQEKFKQENLIYSDKTIQERASNRNHRFLFSKYNQTTGKRAESYSQASS